MDHAGLFLSEPVRPDHVHHHGFQWSNGADGTNPILDRLPVPLADPAIARPRFISSLGQSSILPDIFDDVHNHDIWLDTWMDLHAKILVHHLSYQYIIRCSSE